MKNRRLILTTAAVLVALLSWIPAEGARKMSQSKVLYRIGLVKDKNKTVAVRQSGKNLEFVLEGFGSPVVLKANGGGIETCRTIIKHQSDAAKITLSLPIPMPNAPCQMTAGFGWS